MPKLVHLDEELLLVSLLELLLDLCALILELAHHLVVLHRLLQLHSLDLVLLLRDVRLQRRVLRLRRF